MTKRDWLLALFFGAGAFASAHLLGAQARPRSALAAGTIAGTVVSVGRGDTGAKQGLAAARVTIRSADGGTARSQITDDAGGFAFLALPDGIYSLSALKAGYVPMTYGARDSEGPGVPLGLSGGERLSGLILMLPHGAVITGRVTDEDGEPAAHTYVELLTQMTLDGSSVLAPVQCGAAAVGNNGPMTDDRGEYRFFGIPPGEYLVAADVGQAATGFTAHETTQADVDRALTLIHSPALPSTPAPGFPGLDARRSQAEDPANRVTSTDATVYYPGTVFPSSAVFVHVKAGEEVPGIDLQLQRTRAAAVSGTVTSARVLPAGSMVMIQVVPVEALVARAASPTAQAGPDGHFRLSGMMPGKYQVEARAVSPSSPGAASTATVNQWAVAKIAVNGADVTDVSLSLTGPITLTGRVAFDSWPADLALPAVNISLTPIPLVPGSWLRERTAQSAGANFTVENLTPGRYRLSALPEDATQRPGTAGWILASGVVDGQDAVDAVIDLYSAIGSVRGSLTLAPVAADLSGRVVDAVGRPVSPLRILAFSANAADWYWKSRRIASTAVSSDGQFAIGRLPAGQYYVAALSSIRQQDWFNPTVLQELAPTAIRVDLRAGEHRVRDLQLDTAGR